MTGLANDIAALIYTADAPFVPWDKAIDDDRRHYLAIAQVVLDSVGDSLQQRDAAFSGALAPAIEVLRIEVEASRLARSAADA